MCHCHPLESYQGSVRCGHDALRMVCAGIGRNTQIKGAVIESNVSIGADVTIRNTAGVMEADRADTGGYIIQVN